MAIDGVPSPTSTSRAPRQARSAATLERILDATEELLGHRSVEQIRLDHIVDLAGVSRSSFYARFRTKDEVFAELQQRFADRALAVIDTVPDLLEASDDGLGADVVEVLVRRYADFIEANRRLLLAFEQHPTTRGKATRALATDAVTRRYCDAVGRSDDAAFVDAVTFAARAVAAILLRRLLDQPMGDADREQDGVVRETARMVRAYLDTVPTGS